MALPSAVANQPTSTAFSRRLACKRAVLSTRKKTALVREPEGRHSAGLKVLMTESTLMPPDSESRYLYAIFRICSAMRYKCSSHTYNLDQELTTNKSSSKGRRPLKSRFNLSLSWAICLKWHIFHNHKNQGLRATVQPKKYLRLRLYSFCFCQAATLLNSETLLKINPAHIENLFDFCFPGEMGFEQGTYTFHKTEHEYINGCLISIKKILPSG